MNKLQDLYHCFITSNFTIASPLFLAIITRVFYTKLLRLLLKLCNLRNGNEIVSPCIPQLRILKDSNHAVFRINRRDDIII